MREPLCGRWDSRPEHRTEGLVLAGQNPTLCAYRAQGAHYVRAIHEALQLANPPRFELWFLHPGRIEVVIP